MKAYEVDYCKINYVMTHAIPMARNTHGMQHPHNTHAMHKCLNTSIQPTAMVFYLTSTHNLQHLAQTGSYISGVFVT